MDAGARAESLFAASGESWGAVIAFLEGEEPADAGLPLEAATLLEHWELLELFTADFDGGDWASFYVIHPPDRSMGIVFDYSGGVSQGFHGFEWDVDTCLTEAVIQLIVGELGWAGHQFRHPVRLRSPVFGVAEFTALLVAAWKAGSDGEFESVEAYLDECPPRA